ncbi:PqqD family protein [Halioglobus maricola]|uniref:PqqD family protein n=1 Tax=Halioglobus maricola TaxID=2601894 RepID=A0A5P9NFR3_9GAMM|nr:PqqD family protein [Halioglobus maricola]QFU74643.1 PqqD family protein [Halioglobus maricola]
MNLAQQVSISADAISQEVSGETVILDLKSENYFGLDEVGTRIWQLAESTNTLQDIYDRMLAEYEVDEDQLEEDMEKLFKQLVDMGLVQLSD